MKQLDPKAVWLFFLSSIVRWLFLAIFITIWSGGFFIRSAGTDSEISFGFLGWLWLIIPAVIVLAYIWAQLSYRFYKYELTEAGFRKESGVIYKRYVTIPYDRIQNVDIYRGILARLLGLSDLHIQTAGSSAMMGRGGWATGMMAEGRLPGLSHEIAEQLRDELIQRAKHSKNQGI